MIDFLSLILLMISLWLGDIPSTGTRSTNGTLAKKACVFAVGLPAPQLECQSDIVPVKPLVRYLGAEVPFSYNLPRQLLTLRYETTVAVLRRIAQLPDSL